jgi:hypothetical protein
MSSRGSLVHRFLFVLLLVVTSPVSAATPPTGSTAWRSDLELLRRELPVRHPAPFLNVSRARWDSAATALDRQLPALGRDQALVGFMRLVAMLGDAHTNLEPGPALGLRFYPLELYAFDDGLYVRRADAAHAALVGAKVLHIGRTPADEAIERVAAVIPHENEWWVRAWAPFELMIPEVLAGLSLPATSSTCRSSSSATVASTRCGSRRRGGSPTSTVTGRRPST